MRFAGRAGHIGQAGCCHECCHELGARGVPARRYNVEVAASIEDFSYQLTAEALAEQERALAALRTRAGTVLAAASIAGSFLGAKASHGSLDV